MKELKKLALPPRERLRDLQNADLRQARGGVRYGVGRDPAIDMNVRWQTPMTRLSCGHTCTSTCPTLTGC